MAIFVKFSPAFIRRAFFFSAFAVVAAASTAFAQPGFRPQPDMVQVGKVDQEEGKQILQQFRGLGLPGSYYLSFQLRVMPRRGEERRINGRMWGMLTEQGPVVRIGLTLETGEYRLLIQDGGDSAVWQRKPEANAEVKQLGISDLFTPLAQTDLTAFDLQRPYLGWKEFVYEGITRVRGRPSYKFLLYPPAEFSAQYPALTGVRVYLDTAYKAMVQSEQIGKGGAVLKSMGLQELKKVGDQWIPKSIDLRDETSHNKTRFSVTGAALNQDFVGDLFSSGALAQPISPPPTEKITAIAP